MNLLCSVRAAYGLAQLTMPDLVAQMLGLPPARPTRLTTRVPGARHLIQDAASAPVPKSRSSRWASRSTCCTR